MAFEWRSFLTARRISYVTSGPNVSRGEIGIKCPFCRDDPSEHMAISMQGRGWSCRRDQRHSGKSDSKLVAAVLHCSIDQAHSIVGTRRHLQSDVASVVHQLLDPPEPEEQSMELVWPSEMKTFTGRSIEDPFADYLADRGFDDPPDLSWYYGLRWALRGDFSYRIIFPVEFEGQLVSWTGRSIVSNEVVRYKTLPDRPSEFHSGPLALGPISDYLLWYDDLFKVDADTIVLVEGPFDALKVNVLGANDGVCSTCFFTTGPSANQISLLHSVLPRFKRRFLLQDVGAEARALTTRSALAALDVRSVPLPKGVSDPGDLDSGTWKSLGLRT